MTYAYKGQKFDSEEELHSFIKKWPFLITDEETFKYEWMSLGKHFWMNLKAREVMCTNGLMQFMFEEIFEIYFQKFIENEQKQLFKQPVDVVNEN